MANIKLKYKRAPDTEQVYNRIVSTLFILKEQNRMNTFVFTGCERKAGNTTVCLNIAAELARAGKKTLFVDCDFLKPAEEKRLFQYVDAGLAEYLRGAAELDDIVCDTDIQTLSYISSGVHFINPTMMLWSEKFADFVKSVSEEYEIVIFDTAPVLAAPEVCVLAFRASGTILTVKFGKSLKSQIYASKKELEKMESNFLGVIVNRTPKDECRIYQKTHGFTIALRSSQENKRLPPLL